VRCDGIAWFFLFSVDGVAGVSVRGALKRDDALNACLGGPVCGDEYLPRERAGEAAGLLLQLRICPFRFSNTRRAPLTAAALVGVLADLVGVLAGLPLSRELRTTAHLLGCWRLCSASVCADRCRCNPGAATAVRRLGSLAASAASGSPEAYSTGLQHTACPSNGAGCG